MVLEANDPKDVYIDNKLLDSVVSLIYKDDIIKIETRIPIIEYGENIAIYISKDGDVQANLLRHIEKITMTGLNIHPDQRGLFEYTIKVYK